MHNIQLHLSSNNSYTIAVFTCLQIITRNVNVIVQDHEDRQLCSDVNKDLTLKAKAKDSGFKAKAKAKDSAFKAKAKDRTFEGLNRELDI